MGIFSGLFGGSNSKLDFQSGKTVKDIGLSENEEIDIRRRLEEETKTVKLTSKTANLLQILRNTELDFTHTNYRRLKENAGDVSDKLYSSIFLDSYSSRDSSYEREPVVVKDITSINTDETIKEVEISSFVYDSTFSVKDNGVLLDISDYDSKENYNLKSLLMLEGIDITSNDRLNDYVDTKDSWKNIKNLNFNGETITFKENFIKEYLSKVKNIDLMSNLRPQYFGLPSVKTTYGSFDSTILLSILSRIDFYVYRNKSNVDLSKVNLNGLGVDDFSNCKLAVQSILDLNNNVKLFTEVMSNLRTIRDFKRKDGDTMLKENGYNINHLYVVNFLYTLGEALKDFTNSTTIIEQDELTNKFLKMYSINKDDLILIIKMLEAINNGVLEKASEPKIEEFMDSMKDKLSNVEEMLASYFIILSEGYLLNNRIKTKDSDAEIDRLLGI